MGFAPMDALEVRDGGIAFAMSCYIKLLLVGASASVRGLMIRPVELDRCSVISVYIQQGRVEAG